MIIRSVISVVLNNVIIDTVQEESHVFLQPMQQRQSKGVPTKLFKHRW